ncbi:cation diffusion facilitator family transporter [Heyndrickxia acidicola]|uniref:Cation diffusion facilitator family transporter n=1 Tax=Heyndrickxia acidicola TaxID=209389 RepID=A0ABU6MPR5_9BACI|nr:cation diffusion facilitator family transporter [Heyndrickxia acidicola]MED1205217.1 cation diffusion facilitator family transporter [Heyndrickxia acidicola]
MKELFPLLKKGSRSAFLASVVNAAVAIIKLIAYLYTGNIAMFAETMHSLGDTANQLFVFVGSALSKKPPTNRFPDGFGRLVNLVLLGAVLIVGIMSFETVKEGFQHIFHPTQSAGFYINISVLAAATLLESFVLSKAMREIIHEAGVETKGMRIFIESIKNIKVAKPATKLVFLEDTVSTSGGLLAIISIIISHFTAFHQAEGIASALIGFMMFVVVGKVFMDNAAGVLGESHEEMEEKIGGLLIDDPDVSDIQELRVFKEGEALHVELEIEVDPKLTIEEADDIRDRLEDKIMKERSVTDVIIEFDEDDGVQKWKVDKADKTQKTLTAAKK